MAETIYGNKSVHSHCSTIATVALDEMLMSQRQNFMKASVRVAL